MARAYKSDRRLETRRRYIAEIIYGGEDDVGTGFSWDISLGGMFITANSTIPIGAELLVTIPYPKSTRCVSLQGTVARIADDGFAIAFLRQKRVFQYDQNSAN